MQKTWVKVFIISVSLLSLSLISYLLYGSLIPNSQQSATLFQGALFLIVLGSSLVESKFTKPSDSLINALTCIITLVSLSNIYRNGLWYVILFYCVFVLLSSLVCIAVSEDKYIIGIKKQIAEIAYRPAIFLGKANIIYSLVFLYCLFAFYKIDSKETKVLLLFWGIYLAIWPLKIPELLSKVSFRNNRKNSIGKIVRSDWPSIARVEVNPNCDWDYLNIKFMRRKDGTSYLIIPLYSQIQESSKFGTGYLVKITNSEEGYLNDHIYEYKKKICIPQILGGDESSILIGFVIENSSIEQIRFEIWDSSKCKEGILVWVKIGEIKVYYQVINAITAEELANADRRGFQIVLANQLGFLDKDGKFKKFDWAALMYSPVLMESEEYGEKIKNYKEGDFIYGNIPNTAIQIGGDLVNNVYSHLAILGITGSGKTEFAYDTISHLITKKQKVICIDLTSKYIDHLSALGPNNLSLSIKNIDELSAKLFDVETGAYGAGQEKKVLKEYSSRIREDVNTTITEFIENPQKKLGVIELNEISNTKATIYITEMYLTCLLHYAKDHSSSFPGAVIVVEEAHTVMPEASTMGVSDIDSKGMISRIAQIALQGRKYKVGLIVVAQRTATVSKTVLTQCNTVVSFTCYDDTSINFLSNLVGENYSKAIPNLSFLQALIFGKAVNSDKPIIVNIPFNKTKASR